LAYTKPIDVRNNRQNWISEKMYHKVKPEQALIRAGVGGDVVSFSGLWVLPIVHRAQTMDISSKKIVISRKGAQGLSCKDCIRADIEFAFHLRVRPAPQDVLHVFRWLGAEQASDEKVVFACFEARFVEAMKKAAKTYDFKDLEDARDAFRNQVVQSIGEDLNGFSLDSAAIEYLEQTPLEFLDPKNILDAEGIKKITNERMERESRENRIRRKKELEEAKEKFRRGI
jgi:uncharacterized membrane protein YqiK